MNGRRLKALKKLFIETFKKAPTKTEWRVFKKSFIKAKNAGLLEWQKK